MKSNLGQKKIKSFVEKPQSGSGWINGGFFVLDRDIFNFIKNKNMTFEREPLTKLYKKKKLFGYKHRGFWQCMDTMRDKTNLENLVKKSKVLPWMK